MGIAADARLLDQLVRHTGQIIHHREARAAGFSAGVMQRLAAQDHLVRVGKGAFVTRAEWEKADEWGRFRLRALGFERCTSVDAWLTGQAAAVLLGLPILGRPPALPTMLRPGSAHTASDRTPWGRTRTGYLPTGQRTRRDGARCTDFALTAVDLARHEGPIAGLMAADAALALGAHRDELAGIVDRMPTYPGISTAAWAVEHADPRADSPLETLGRHAFLAAGRKPPLTNVWITVSGRWFRVDHLLADEGVVLEADGAIKYNNRADAAVVVRDQNERERLLRSLGLEFVRYDWWLAWNRPFEIVRRSDQASRSRMRHQPFEDWSWAGPAGMKSAEM